MRPSPLSFPERDAARLCAGRYEIGEPIGSGGLGTVHRGRLVRPGGFSRAVAIKRLHVDGSERATKAILDEARIASAIRHPNVVATIDVVAEDDDQLIVMELVEGTTLRRLLDPSSLPPPRIALRIMADVLRGLEAAHRATDEAGAPLGIVHRDVAPPNVIVGRDGLTRLTDFGIAKARGRLLTTRDGNVKGHLGYLAPEQIAGDPVDARTDLFGAGAILWEALAGRRLFDGESDGAIVYGILERPIPRPSEHGAAVPAAVEAVVMRALARAPAERFASAREMADSLEASMPIASHAEVAAFVETTGAFPRPAPAALADRASPPRRPRLALAAALVVLLAGAGAGAWWRRHPVAVRTASANVPAPTESPPTPPEPAPSEIPPAGEASAPSTPVTAAPPTRGRAFVRRAAPTATTPTRLYGKN